MRVTCSLPSTAITPLHQYYEAVRSWLTHRYFRPRGASACAFSLNSAKLESNNKLDKCLRRAYSKGG